MGKSEATDDHGAPLASAPRPRRIPVGSPLRNRVILMVLGSQAISSLGSQMSGLALPWFVLITTGSATRMGLVFAVELLPASLLGVPAGQVIARFGVRAVMLTGDAARALLTAVIPVLFELHALSFPALLLVVFCTGVFSGPYLTAQRLFFPACLGDDDAIVAQTNALLDSSVRLASLLGPAVAGTLIAALGAINVLWIDAASFAISFSMLAAGLSALPARSTEQGPQSSALAGARFVLHHALLSRVSLCAVAFGAFFPMLLASLPITADVRFNGNPRIAGLLFATWAIGSLIGAMGVVRFARTFPPVRMGVFAAFGFAVPLWLLSLPLNAWEFGAVLAVSGVFTPMVSAPLITLITLRTPKHLQPQVLSFVVMANLIAGPLGYALIGPAVQGVGLRGVFLIIAGGTSFAALLMTTLIGQDKPGQGEEATIASSSPAHA
jgi:MFS family permease